MASGNREDSKDRLNKLISAGSDVDKVYTEWAEKFDGDMDKLSCVGYIEIVENTLALVDVKETSLLLDVAAGTGACGEVLRDRGYKGVMDALEMNAAMLEIAKTKSLYRNHIQFTLSPDVSLPVKDLYDVIICSGAFLPNHIEPGCITPIVNCLKRGGALAFNLRNTEKNKEYNGKLGNIIMDLMNSGIIEKVADKDVDHYRSVDSSDGKVDPLKTRFLMYRRIGLGPK